MGQLAILHVPVMPSLSYTVRSYVLELQGLCPGILKTPKVNQPPKVLKAGYIEHAASHAGGYAVYTDGSKTDNGGGYAVALLDRPIAKRVSPFASIYAAELNDILKAIAYFL